MEILNNFNDKEKNNFANPESSKNIKKNIKRSLDPNVLLIIFGLIMGFIISGSFGVNLFSKDDIKIPKGEIKAFEQNGKTWVAFDDPVVNATIITDKDCENCDYQEVIEMIKGAAIPTLNVREINFDAEEALKLIELFNIRSIPAFIFDSRLIEIKEYGQIKDVFINKGESYYLDSVKAGIPIGKLIKAVKINKNDISKGSEHARVTIVEFSDFECSFCFVAKETIKQVLDEYGDDVRVVYKHFPLPTNKNAKKAAEASQCANDQGKFWEMHDAMFEDQSKLSIPDLKQTAKNIGLDANDFNDCLDSGKYDQKVQDDIDLGYELGISGTPAFFIESEFLSGAQPIEEFEKIIDKKLNK